MTLPEPRECDEPREDEEPREERGVEDFEPDDFVLEVTVPREDEEDDEEPFLTE